MRCRIDFEYALAMELDDPGFHHSVLTDFRDRLREGDRADSLLDLALERMRSAGLLKERGRQRTDSSQVLAAARELTRLELVLEAVRAAQDCASPQNMAGRELRVLRAAVEDVPPMGGTPTPAVRGAQNGRIWWSSCSAGCGGCDGFLRVLRV
ncbi:transposase [Streptomyces sp. NPDC003863]